MSICEISLFQNYLTINPYFGKVSYSSNASQDTWWETLYYFLYLWDFNFVVSQRADTSPLSPCPSIYTLLPREVFSSAAPCAEKVLSD